MGSQHAFPKSGFDRGSMPLDAARSSFQWLVTGPEPLSVDGRTFPGLPDRSVPLDEVRDRLLRRQTSQATRDRVWAHLVLRSRTDGGAWTVGAVGVALPALLSIASTLTARFANDPSDIHAAVLTGFVAALGEADLRRPRIMLRLRWAAYRAGHAAVREALDAPVPTGHGLRASTAPPPTGHPDFVLARAIAEGAITATEAELIGVTRLEGASLAAAAADRNLSYEAAKKARQRAEHRLVAYLLDTDDSEADGHDLSAQVADTVTVTNAAHLPFLSRSVTPLVARKGSRRVSPTPRLDGVQGRGRRSAPASTTSSSRSPRRPTDSTSGESRCA
ncbi:hypothetical protein [Actinokineospora pegani]|uniref:hypothetical protein n=1 Tax=Actinokineospora pegani TaxID=2654637 RepID=UPI0012E9EB03|nr:hypothetical protein [Actinokineospora pegani]